MSRILVLVLALVAVQVVADPPVAQAAGLTCGRAFIDYDAPRGTSVIHSCEGSGTVQYEVNCRTSSNFRFSHTYHEPGASIRRLVSCDSFGGTWNEVSWKIV